MLVARAGPPAEVFAAVTAEAGRLLSADITILYRYDPDDGATVIGATVVGATVVGAWSSTGGEVPPAGARVRLGGRNPPTLVFQTRRPARIDDYAEVTGPLADVARDRGIRASVSVPINVEGRLWGVLIVASTRTEGLPADTGERLADFTELVATAIADAQARLELRGYAEEQAALRRVATLVARAAPPEEVFAAVTAEVGRVLAADITVLNRFDGDGAETVVGAWSRSSIPPVAVGTRTRLGGRNVTTLVHETGRPARIDDYTTVTGPVGDIARKVGIRAAVGVPISAEGRLWGAVLVASQVASPPADTEARLAGFTELVATAIANAEAQAALTASRARLVATSDMTRRRIERDLHDGAQQRLVSLALWLQGTVRAAAPPDAQELTAQLDQVATELSEVLDELREIAHGLHPAALAEGGLCPALTTLSRRSAVPVRLDVRVEERLPEPIELAAYYAVCEALTNAAKHADASVVDVEVETAAGVLHVRVHDDGRGGADLTRGSGLVGLTDRAEALGGRLSLHSPPDAGTTLDIALPLTAPAG